MWLLVMIFYLSIDEIIRENESISSRPYLRYSDGKVRESGRQSVASFVPKIRIVIAIKIVFF